MAVGCHRALKVSRGAIIIVEVAEIIHCLCSLERHLGSNTHGGSIVVVEVDSGHILCIEVLLWHGFNRMWSGRSWHCHRIWNHPMPQSTHVPVNLILVLLDVDKASSNNDPWPVKAVSRTRR